MLKYEGFSDGWSIQILGIHISKDIASLEIWFWTKRKLTIMWERV